VKRNLRTFVALAALAIAGLAGVGTRTHAQTLTTGSIAGTVTDANGSKLSGVQITVDTGQMDVTNASGYFIITDILPGAHSVEASLVGYQPVKATNVIVTQEQVTTVTLQLAKRNVQRAATTVVQVPLIHKNVTPTIYTVTSKEEQLVRSQPNNLYQYPGALISQPGIVPDQNGYPSVRGSRQNEVGYMLDGILVTEPITGQFATNMVTVGMDRMNVYTGGYRAELGNSIGGIINAAVKTGASIRGAAVEASTGSWQYSGLVYEQGNVEKSGLNWYVSGNVFRTDFEKNPATESLPLSEDIVGKFVMPIGKLDRVTLLYTQGQEHYEYPVNNPFTGKPWGQNPLDPARTPGVQGLHEFTYSDSLKDFVSTPPTQDYEVQMHNIGSFSWAHSFTPATTLSAQVYSWDHHVNFHALSDYSLTDEGVGNKETSGKVEFASQFSPALQYRVGGQLLHSKNFLFLGANVTSALGFTDEHNNLIPVWEISERNANTDDRNAYLSTTWKPSERITMDAGVRYDSRQYHRTVTMDDINNSRASTKAADLEVLNRTGFDPRYSTTTPRVGLTYSLNPTTLLKASAGQFAQFAPTNYLDRRYLPTRFDTPIPGYVPEGVNYYQWRSRKVFDVKPEKVDGVDLGIEKQIGKTIGIAVTPYYKRTKDMFDYGQAYDYAGNAIGGGTAWSNIAHGHTRGVETKLQFREQRGMSGWITYTFQEAKGTTTASFPGTDSQFLTRDLKEHRLDYDQKHTIYLVGQYRKGKIEVNPMLELGSGYPWGQPGDFFNQDTGEVNPYYSSSPNPADLGAALPILVNGKLQSDAVNPYNTGWHNNLSATFRLYTDSAKSSYYFLQVQNITRSQDVTAKYWRDPFSGSNSFGYVGQPVDFVDENGQTAHAPGYFEYKPYTTVPPIFVLVGVHKTF
jgi:outer membrane receptor protein involved in Fe transport